MPFSNFGARARANMEVVLEEICKTMPDGQKHDVRAAVASGIKECAEGGKTGIKAMAAAGKAALKRMQTPSAPYRPLIPDTQAHIEGYSGPRQPLGF